MPAGGSWSGGGYDCGACSADCGACGPPCADAATGTQRSVPTSTAITHRNIFTATPDLSASAASAHRQFPQTIMPDNLASRLRADLAPTRLDRSSSLKTHLTPRDLALT